MDKETKFKLGIPRIFKSSYASCRSRIFSDATVVVGTQPSSVPQTHNSDIYSSLPAAPKKATDSSSFPSICKPKSTQTLNQDSHHKVTESSKRRGCNGLNTHALFYYGDVAASPVSSMILDREFYQKPKSKKESKKSRSKRMSRSSSRQYSSRRLCRVDSAFLSSNSENDYNDDENDDVFFSSRSWSSGSSRSQKSHGDSAVGCEMMNDSVAVVKSSSDPYEDFRTSMVEMIVEKQIMAGKDLEKLLQSFLALNSRHHHRVILEVFMEIWEALFCDWS
ncbi:unnamed protein product [Rhodiola kirilowii]